ncbi:MAG: hypothetical protein AAGG44_05240, partial [Planctomycetota bacterium]
PKPTYSLQCWQSVTSVDSGFLQRGQLRLGDSNGSDFGAARSASPRTRMTPDSVIAGDLFLFAGSKGT